MKPPSLTQLFEAPDDHVGIFGWVCGYSADALTIGDATERFTRATANRRAQDGCIALALMLDPGERELSLLDVPGVAHLPVRQPDALPFKLLHAKVALLGFRPLDGSPGWRLRLIVSTGNWTVETLEHSLDLAWSVDVSGSQLDADDENLAQRCADVTAAADLLAWLRPYFDDSVLAASVRGRPGPAARAIAQMQSWLDACRRVVGGLTPRFFDNRQHGLLQQLPALVVNNAGKSARNCLAMGSGFYESQAQPGQAPAVLENIVSTLRDKGLLTKSSKVHVFVNERACQAVANSMKAIAARSWAVRPAGRPAQLYGLNSQRTLHAKFLLSVYDREHTNRCSSPWLYLGSGNLTNAGFVQRASRGGGNLEAGVVFQPPELLWSPDADQPHVPAVNAVLPVQWDEELTPETPPAAGGDMPERPPAFVAAPLTWLRWEAEGGQGTLVPPEDAAVDAVEVVGPDGQPCVRAGAAWHWPGDCPRQVDIRWDEGQQTRALPVLDPFGRIAPLPLASLQIDQLGRELERFPATGGPDDDDDDSDPGTPPPASNPPRPKPATTGAAGSYALRLVIQQLETIARKQTALDEADWPAWCQRLEQVLAQASDSTDLAAFRRLGLNPLSPLRAAPFRPDFALDRGTDAGRCYEEALDRVEQAWKVEKLLPLGELQ